MPIEAQEETPGRVVVRITGALTKPEFEAFQQEMKGLMEARGSLDVLCTTEGFEGWTGAGWDDPSIHEFAFTHDEDVRRIAIVGEPQHEDRLVVFAGGYGTSREVKFFTPDQADEARAWLS